MTGPAATEKTLAQEMERVLFELWLLPWGTITNYNSSGGGHGDASREPPGVVLDGPSERPPYEYWTLKWQNAISPLTKEKVFQGATAELDRWRHKPAIASVAETNDQLELRMIREGEGWPIEDVARHFKCLPKLVRDVRRRHGMSVDTGKMTAVQKLDDEGARARDLAAKGMTERQIRMILNCGGSKLARLKNEAA